MREQKKNCVSIREKDFRTVLLQENFRMKSIIRAKILPKTRSGSKNWQDIHNYLSGNVKSKYFWRNDLGKDVGGRCIMGGMFIEINSRLRFMQNRAKALRLVRGIVRHELLHIFESNHNRRFLNLATIVDAPKLKVEERT